MNVHILIADARPLFRKVLHDIFAVDAEVTSITEAATGEELIKQLQANSFDLVLAQQSLITDISLLPRNHFALITAVPDKHLFLTACEHGLSGYLTEGASEELLRRVLHATPDHPVIDPSLTVWMAKLLVETGREFPDEILTRREREVLALKMQHRSNREIASALCIAESTVKLYVWQIRKKIPGISW
jgi:DNA-binding NarL/FixJ family response regulator